MKRPVFIILVGHNGSGKTTLAKQLEKDIGINVVSGDPLRLLLKKEILFFNDFDVSTLTNKGNITHEIISNYRETTCIALLNSNQNVIHDANSFEVSYRKNLIEKIRDKVPEVTTIIIYLKLDEKTILERLANRPEKNWHNHYFEHKKDKLQEPNPNEAEQLFIYDQSNYQDILDKLRKLT